MCRWLAYRGRPIFLERLLFEPQYSLIEQSLNARKAKAPTNGDGFGLGWYGERDTPGTFHEVLPAWSDGNLRSLAHHLRSRLFFAHVRASTGTATSRANCHPFSHGRWMFMHNGQVGGYERIRRRIEALIPDALYCRRRGTTDSEAIFLAALGMGLEQDPQGALASTLSQVERLMQEADIGEPLRFTAALTDGERIFAIRYSSDDHPPSLYMAEDEDGVLVVSEPLDEALHDWKAVPPGIVVEVGAHGSARPQAFR